MTLFTQAEVFALARQSGFENKDAEVATAIAMVESLAIVGGTAYADSTKIGDVSLANEVWGPSYGLWQVRSLHAQTGKGGYRDRTRLPEPEFNGRAAYQVWLAAGRSFRPWSTFTSGAYQGYMQQAKYNPKPEVPVGTYMVTGGDFLSRIGQKTKHDWRLIAAINRVSSPYTIFPGQVLLLPDFEYTVKAGDSLSKIAAAQSTVTWQRIAEYNELKNPNLIQVGQVIKVPRYASWDGKTLSL